MEQAVRKNDIQGYFYLNVGLYDFFFKCCPNDRLRNMANQFGKQILRFRFKSMSQPGHINRSFEKHASLLRSLKAKDLEQSTKVAEEIIYNALAVLQKSMTQE